VNIGVASAKAWIATARISIGIGVDMTDGPYTTITVEEYNRLRAVADAARDCGHLPRKWGSESCCAMCEALAALRKLDQGGDRSEGGLRDGL
jgi:hypothetical protein